MFRTLLYIGVLGIAIALWGVCPAYAQEKPKGAVEETGEIAGAEFLIKIPENWNGGLIMYAHGYEVVSPSRRDFNRSFANVGNQLGYAVAQSKYSVQGWAAREGVLDTEALRRHFVSKYGRTYPTFIAGHSQGGAITFKTIEQFPESYDGALPMCAVAEPALKFFKENVFDARLLFDYLMPGLPGSVVEFPDGAQTMAKAAFKINALVKENPEKAELFLKMVKIPNLESIAPVVAFWTEILRELQIRTGGNAFDNRSTIYSGSGDDAKLNREIKRYSADAKSVEYLRQWVTPTGRIADPVISIHTFVDQLVPVQGCQYYEQLTQVAGTTENFVQLYVDRVGHCAFSEEEMSEGLRRLDAWARNGQRPAAGDITVMQK